MTRREQFAASALSGLIGGTQLDLQSMQKLQEKPDLMIKFQQALIISAFTVCRYDGNF